MEQDVYKGYPRGVMVKAPRNRSKQVQTPVALLRSLSDKYSKKKKKKKKKKRNETPYPPSY